MIKYQDGYRYQLVENYQYQTSIKPAVVTQIEGYVRLYPSGLLEIKEGYAWDGASGPALDTANVMRASLVHDALYQLMREGSLDLGWREAADYELWNICRADGVTWFRAWYIYQGVRRFGQRYAEPHMRAVLTAP